MKDTPDSFDHLVKSKLDEVEVDPSLADAYWQQMQLPVAKLTGTSKFRRYYWFGSSVLLTVLVIFVATKRDKKVSSNANATIIQQANKATPVNTYDTVLMMEKKRITVSQPVTELQVTKQNMINKSDTDKSVPLNNQLKDKPVDDSILNHQTTATLNALNQPKIYDTLSISKEALTQTSIQQADIDLKKIDSLSKKPEAKKKAPHIIW